jgi:hypothetical protein
MPRLSHPIRPCPVVIRKREIHVRFSSNGNTPKSFDISNGYHVVLPTFLLQQRLDDCRVISVSMLGKGARRRCGIVLSMAFLLWRQDTVCPGTDYCEVVQGYVILTLYTSLLHIHVSHLLLRLNTVHLVLLNTPQKFVELLGLKLCIACVCCVPLRSQAIHNIWSVLCSAFVVTEKRHGMT